MLSSGLTENKESTMAKHDKPNAGVVRAWDKLQRTKAGELKRKRAR